MDSPSSPAPSSLESSDSASILCYYHCFLYLIPEIFDESKWISEMLEDDGTLEFTFDHRQQSEYNAGFMYDMMINSVEWKYHNVFMQSKISFDTRKNPRVQAADLFARETMKHLDNRIGPCPRPTRKSTQCLLETERFRFIEFDREWHIRHREITEKFDFLKASIQGMQEAFGMKVIPDMDYGQWLAKFKLADNWTNRFRYAAWLETQRKGSMV